VVKVGEEIEVKILRVDSEERKIGLSLKRARWAAEDMTAEPPQEPIRRRGGLGAETGLLGKIEDQPLMSTSRSEQAQAEGPPSRREKKIDQEQQADQIATEALGEGGEGAAETPAPPEGERSSPSPDADSQEQDKQQ